MASESASCHIHTRTVKMITMAIASELRNKPAKLYDLRKRISVLLWLTRISRSVGLQNFVKQPAPFGNDQTIKNVYAQQPQLEVMPPFPPNYPIPFPYRGMPYETNDFNLQYQQPQYMPPIRLDIQFMPPPVYQFQASRPFMPLPPQMSAPYPFFLAPLAVTDEKNKTASAMSPVYAASNTSEADTDDTKGNKTRRSVGLKFSPRFYVVEDTETKVIDTWREASDFMYFSNKWPMGIAPRPKISYIKKNNMKQYKNKHVGVTQHPLIIKTTKSDTSGEGLTKKIKNMVRIIPLKKDILREVTAKLKELKARGKLSPLVGRLFKYENDKYGPISKILDFHAPLNAAVS